MASSRKNLPSSTSGVEDKISLDHIVAEARWLLVSSPMAQAYAIGALGGRHAKVLLSPFEYTFDLELAQPRRGRPTLMIAPTRSSSAEFIAIRHIADLMRRRGSHASILVAGATFDDLRLMSHESVFVTGGVEPAELGRVLQSHNVQWMLTGFDQPLFGHPLIELVRSSQTPVAYLDWSAGAIRPRSGDLAIGPDASPKHVAMAVDSWIEGS